MRKIILLLLVTTCMSKCEWFAYDRAICDAQRQDWDNALRRLNVKLTDSPDDPSLLYDAGVVCFKAGNYKQSQDYFKRAVQSQAVDKDLQEKSYFNLGNAYCALKEYESAVNAYKQALKIDSADEHARHNLKKAQELLVQQEKQEQQEKKEQNDKQKQQSQESRDKKEGQEQNKQDNQSESDQKKDAQADEDKGKRSSGCDKQGAGQKNDQHHQKQDGQSRQGQQPPDKGQQGSERENDSQGSDERQQQKKTGSSEKFDRKQGEHADDTEKQKQDKHGGEQQSERKSAGNDGDRPKDAGREQKFDDHGSSPLDQNGQKRDSKKEDAELGAQAQAMQVQQQGEKQAALGVQDTESKKIDSHLMWIMKEQERKDAARSKGLIKGMIGKQLVGQDGQHCW